MESIARTTLRDAGPGRREGGREVGDPTDTVDPMDRPLGRGVRRRLIVRRVLPAVGVGALVVLGLGWGAGALRPSLSRGEIRTGRVDVGRLEAIILATGTVMPEIEQVVSMPVEARVLKIRKRPGDTVALGEAILDLDLEAAELAQEKLDQALAQRVNQQEKTRLELEARMNDLVSQRKVKTLQLGALKAQTDRDRQLQQRGLLARESLAQAELLEAQAGVELERIAADQAQARAATRATLAGLGLEMATLRRERTQARRQLERATTRADRPGVVTWTVTEEGATVRQGEVIARVADLRSFRVDATISDVHAQRVAAGLPVLVKVSDAARPTELAGTITQVHPTIRDGVLTFSVALKERSSPLLRSNLRVDVLVILSRKERVLRIPRGPFAEAGGVREVFVIRDNRAVRTAVRLGSSGPDHLEVLSGLRPGDEAIISDMTDHLSLPEIDLH
jgi:HlyD family secretion protein